MIYPRYHYYCLLLPVYSSHNTQPFFMYSSLSSSSPLLHSSSRPLSPFRPRTPSEAAAIKFTTIPGMNSHCTEPDSSSLLQMSRSSSLQQSSPLSHGRSSHNSISPPLLQSQLSFKTIQWRIAHCDQSRSTSISLSLLLLLLVCQWNASLHSS